MSPCTNSTEYLQLLNEINSLRSDFAVVSVATLMSLAIILFSAIGFTVMAFERVCRGCRKHTIRSRYMNSKTTLTKLQQQQQQKPLTNPFTLASDETDQQIEFQSLELRDQQPPPELLQDPEVVNEEEEKTKEL
jgi:hypothetical protein